MTIKIIADGASVGGARFEKDSTVTLSDDAESVLIQNGFAAYLPNFEKGQVIAIAHKSTQVITPADTNENVVFSMILPAGLIGPRDSLRISAAMTNANNANAKNWRLRMNGSLLFSINGASATGCCLFSKLSNRNSFQNQIVNNLSTAITSSVLYFNIDMTQTQVLQLSCQKAVAGDAAALESILIELIKES